jgi:hypothetical protein
MNRFARDLSIAIGVSEIIAARQTLGDPYFVVSATKSHLFKLVAKHFMLDTIPIDLLSTMAADAALISVPLPVEFEDDLIATLPNRASVAMKIAKKLTFDDGYSRAGLRCWGFVASNRLSDIPVQQDGTIVSRYVTLAEAMRRPNADDIIAGINGAAGGEVGEIDITDPDESTILGRIKARLPASFRISHSSLVRLAESLKNPLQVLVDLGRDVFVVDESQQRNFTYELLGTEFKIPEVKSSESSETFVTPHLVMAVKPEVRITDLSYLRFPSELPILTKGNIPVFEVVANQVVQNVSFVDGVVDGGNVDDFILSNAGDIKFCGDVSFIDNELLAPNVELVRYAYNNQLA